MACRPILRARHRDRSVFGRSGYRRRADWPPSTPRTLPRARIALRHRVGGLIMIALLTAMLRAVMNPNLIEMQTVKLTIALVPVPMLLYGSVVLFRARQSVWVSFQLTGSAFLVVVVFAHICEA